MSASNWISLIGAIASPIFALIGVFISNSKASSLIAYRLEQLEQKVAKHNQVVERTYALERDMAVVKERLNERSE